MQIEPIRTQRREFLQTTSAAVAGSVAALAMSRSVHAAGTDLLKVGLIGCGGRGSDAARQALLADNNVKLWAMADAFENRLELSLKSLQTVEAIAAKIDVPPERRFTGFDGYKGVIETCDVVLLCTPPHFRPMHLKAAVEAGKHVFAEKPCAVDAPGVRSVLASCEEAKKRNLSVVSGLCLRYDQSFQEAASRIHDGAVGKIMALQANDYRGTIWVKPRLPEWSDMTWQMRNWYYFTWLSGDFNVEQHVHMLDACAWLMKNEYPVKAVGMGGRAVRTGEEYGQIFDHFSIVYEYADGTKFYSNCRQQAGCSTDMSVQVMGSGGIANLSERKGGMSILSGEKRWTYAGEHVNMYQAEHNELFAAIRADKPINNGEYMAKSSLLAIMGRMAAYTGQAITWDMAMNSKEDLSPTRYDWDLALPVAPIARPGVTQFV